MTELDSTLPAPDNTPNPVEQPDPPRPKRPNRLRRFFLLHLPFSLAALAGLLALTVVGLYFWASSIAFENSVRKQLIVRLQDATGGRVEIRSFHWQSPLCRRNWRRQRERRHRYETALRALPR